MLSCTSDLSVEAYVSNLEIHLSMPITICKLVLIVFFILLLLYINCLSTGYEPQLRVQVIVDSVIIITFIITDLSLNLYK